jgi:two-component system, sensor histidine kinase
MKSKNPNILDQIDDVVIVVDHSGQIQQLNAAFQNQTGFTQKDFLNEKFTKLVPTAFRFQLLLQTARFLRDKKKHTQLEIPILKKDGEKFWVSAKLSANYSEANTSVVAIAREIPDIKILQPDYNQIRLRSLLENLNSGMLLEDENRRILMVNEKFCELFCIPVEPAALLGADCSGSARQAQVLFKDELGFVFGIERLLRERRKAIGDVLPLKDGRVFSRDFIPVSNNGVYLGHLWSYTDITASQKVQENIRRKEEKYLGIINNMKLGLLEVDLNNIITDTNERFCELTGYTRNELLGKNASKLLLAQDHYSTVEEQKNIRSKGESSVYEIELIKKDGTRFWIMISGAPRYDDNRKMIGSIGIHLDLTEQKQTESALIEAKIRAEQSLTAKEQFMANMSHELRTPLNAVIGMAELLKDSPLTKKQNSYVDAIIRSGDNLLSIINEILDFSKILTAHFKLQNRVFNFSDAVNNVADTMWYQAHKKAIDFHWSVPENIPPFLIGDPLRIGQLLTNLLGNSIKFTSDGLVKLDVSFKQVSKTEISIKFEVTDTGIGISKDKLEHIFEMFTQEDDSITREFGGTGLGLAISKQLTELMGGKISVQSEKGKGSVFICNIPFKIANENIPENFQINSNYKALKGKHVLLVEDNPMNVTIAGEHMKKAGIIVTVAHSGDEAIEALKNAIPDIILMDISMPGMDGVQTLRKIYDELRIFIPVVAVTANSRRSDKENYLREGMSNYLSKPFSKVQLLTVIKNTLPDNSLYDLGRLHLLGSSELVETVIEAFIEQTPVLVNQLIKAHFENNYSAMRHLCHQLKTSVSLFSVNAISPILEELDSDFFESIWKEGNKQFLPQIVYTLRETVKGLKAGATIFQNME